MHFHPMGYMDSPTPNAHEYLDLTWEMFGELCRALALRVARDYEPEVVVAIARAGALPGAVISSIYGVEFYSMTISRKVGRDQIRDRPEILSAAPPQCAGKRVLLVDEICTTGETMRLGLAAVRDTQAAEVRTAASFVRHSGYKPDYFSIETDATVIFPWDRKVYEDNDLVVNPRYREVIEE